jgi:hypothetical protein
MMGGALGLAVLASVAAARTTSLAGRGRLPSLLAGYHLAFLAGAVFAAAATGVVLFRTADATADLHAHGGEAAPVPAD